MKKIVFLLLFFSAFSVCYAQETLPTEDATHIFWQAGRPLTAADFQGDAAADTAVVRINETYGMNEFACVGFWSIMDVSKKRRQPLQEKIYFVPAFEKGTSSIMNRDAATMIYEQLTFDIYELSARVARKKLDDIHKQAGMATGIKAIMFKTVERDAIEFRRELMGRYIQSVFKYKVEGAYQKWREAVDAWLRELEEYATTPEDCYRFIKGEPVDPRYKQAEYVWPAHEKPQPESEPEKL
jgi:hypothetical protein